MRLRHLALLVVAAVAVGSQVVVSPAESAPRAWSPLEVSADGRSWAQQPPEGLFAGARVWVPGDRTTRTLLVRNRSSETATVRVQVVLRAQDRWPAPGGLRTWGRAARGWVALSAAAGHRSVQRTVPAGQVRTIRVRLAMDARAGSTAMSRTMPVRILVTSAAAQGR